MVSFMHHLFEVGEAASKPQEAIKPVTFVPLSPRRPDGSLRDRS
jgi:hypothetical protein